MAVGDLAGSDDKQGDNAGEATVTPDVDSPSPSPELDATDDATDETLADTPAATNADTESDSDAESDRDTASDHADRADDVPAAATETEAVPDQVDDAPVAPRPDDPNGSEGSATPPPPPPLIGIDRPRRDPVEPQLPDVPAQASPSTLTVAPASAASTRGLHFRSDEERNRSVYRRANPWYRQLARGMIALSLLAVVGAGAFFTVRVVQNWLDRAQLPSPGLEHAAFRTTTFQIRSTAPAPALEGTLTIDTANQAFEFIGGPAGPQSGQRVVSADGGVAYSRTGNGSWLRIADNDPLNRDIRQAVAYLVDDSSADAILTNRLRRGYIDLIREVDEGEGAGALTRYDLVLNTRAFALDFPLQWQDFQTTAIPGVEESGALPVSIRVDSENVLVALTDDETGWRWQRLNYFDRAATIVNPADSLLQATTSPTPAPAEAPDTSVPTTEAPGDG